MPASAMAIINYIEDSSGRSGQWTAQRATRTGGGGGENSDNVGGNVTVCGRGWRMQCKWVADDTIIGGGADNSN